MPVYGVGAGGFTSGKVLWATAPLASPLPTQESRQAPQFPTVEAAGVGTYAIVDHANTQVIHVGSGAYTIEKISGSAATFDADAVSSSGISGGFVLRIKFMAPTTGAYTAGVNADPLTDSSYTSIDRQWVIGPSGNYDIYEGGSIITTVAPSSYAWIWRIGTTLYYGRGADFATAQASPDRTVTDTNTLYFDSGFRDVGEKMEVLFASLTAGAGASTEDADTAAGTATVRVAGAGASTEDVDAAAATGTVRVSGASASTETNDTASGTAGVTVSGAIASTEASDTAAATGTVGLSGVVASTEEADAASAAGAVTVSGSAAAAEDNDTAALTGGVTASGTLAANDNTDTVSATGAVLVSGVLGSTEDADNAAGTGTVSIAGVSGAIAALEAEDTADGVATVRISGSVAAVEQADTAATTGSVAWVGWVPIPIASAIWEEAA